MQISCDTGSIIIEHSGYEMLTNTDGMWIFLIVVPVNVMQPCQGCSYVWAAGASYESLN